MGSLNLTVTSPAQTFIEPLTLTEVKAYLRIPERSPTDSAEDDMLETLIASARECAELEQNQDLVEKQWDLTLESFSDEIELRHPLVSVDLVRYRDSDGNYTTLTEGTDYIVDTAKRPGIIRPPYGESWPSFTPWPSSPILIRFSSGYDESDVFWSDAGKRLKVGMLMLMSHLYNSRLPFELGPGQIQEYPYAVTQLFRSGAIPRVR